MSQQPPRFTTIGDGVTAQVIDRRLLPPSLTVLLGQLRAVREVSAVLPVGARAACTQGEHDLQPFREGVWQQRELRLSLCAYCGTVEVRDVSLDLLAGVAAGTGGARRRSAILGWYSGSRPKGRTYM